MDHFGGWPEIKLKYSTVCCFFSSDRFICHWDWNRASYCQLSVWSSQQTIIITGEKWQLLGVKGTGHLKIRGKTEDLYELNVRHQKMLWCSRKQYSVCKVCEPVWAQSYIFRCLVIIEHLAGQTRVKEVASACRNSKLASRLVKRELLLVCTHTADLPARRHRAAVPHAGDYFAKLRCDLCEPMCAAGALTESIHLK